jgi:hypothetical protein
MFIMCAISFEVRSDTGFISLAIPVWVFLVVKLDLNYLKKFPISCLQRIDFILFHLLQFV